MSWNMLMEANPLALIYLKCFCFIKKLILSTLQKADEPESVEPPKPEKKKTRKGKRAAASPEEEEADEGEAVADAERRNGEEEEEEGQVRSLYPE